MAQTEGAPATVLPLTPEACDLACQILKVPQKPGGGGGIINGITPKLDARVPGEDLGVVRPPSESLRLPDLTKNNLNIKIQEQ
ncbi:hypothetical protein NKJ35_25035 [Mesorhizobium sp. M0136]|uniref:hypothetical protein n=1 Tax=Mesorhizobium sp. M0136 TaxID=2956890 RepID=UPI00333B29F7